MQGNPLWSLEVRADFGQLGLEFALLLAIFSKVMMSRLSSSIENNLKTHCLAWKIFKQMIVRHDISLDIQDLKLFRSEMQLSGSKK